MINYLRTFIIDRQQQFCILCNSNTLSTKMHTIMECKYSKVIKQPTDLLTPICSGGKFDQVSVQGCWADPVSNSSQIV